jgi:hypothetical protein
MHAYTIGLVAAATLISGCTGLPHRDTWQLDPQGRAVNLGPEDCRPPRVAYYIYPDGVTPVYLECLRDHFND